MTTMKNFILDQSTEIISSFFQSALKNILECSPYIHIYGTRRRASLNGFGNEKALFVAAIEDIVKIFNRNFAYINQERCICTGLSTWIKLFKFIVRTFCDQ